VLTRGGTGETMAEKISYRTVIRPNQSWVRLPWREVWEYRDLLWFLVKRDLTAVYKQSILGPLWFVIQPLATTLVFTVVFGNVAKIPTDGVPPFLFYLSGMLLWSYFARCMDFVSNALIANTHVLGKVYIPRLTLPLSIVISSLAQFLLNFLTFLAFYAYFYFCTDAQLRPSWWIFTLPLLVCQAAAVGLGVGLWLAALTVKYRDLRFAFPFLSQLWLFLTPIVYPASVVSAKWRPLLAVNPIASIVELNRYAFLGSGFVSARFLSISFAMGAVLLISGLMVFNRVQRTFADTI